MKAAEIREKFINFFDSKSHQIVPSASLVPANDPTLLFTNAGMVQFKDVFLGLEHRPYRRAVSAQRCVRAGGKHNDLENVGYTARHHTFFEMLGNFSFGDYFKREAIHFAWELLTQIYQLPPEKLWVTVYHEDDEAYDIWAKEIKVPVTRLIRIGDNKGARYASDNFWQMAEVGPCGPSSEIFYDHGPEVWGGPPGSAEEDGDRYIEVWNLVFMQFNRDAKGNLTPLPKPCVDTGMGLERIAAILQGVHSNYEIDLFQRLIRAAARVTSTSDLAQNSLKVIADHLRAASFLIVDGVLPANEGRGYVLRRIIRRAIRHGYQLDHKKPFLHQLVADLAAEMGEAYPELVAEQARVTDILRQEEERFLVTIEHGMALLETAIASIQTKVNATGLDNPGNLLASVKILPGDIAFKLHDTYGFPLDLTADVCREQGISVDEAGFEVAMSRQREQARAAGKFKSLSTFEYNGAQTVFSGYQTLLGEHAKVVALYVNELPVNQLVSGQAGVVVLDQTPFYAQAGGQAGDQGVLSTPQSHFVVNDTLKLRSDVIGHYGTLAQGELSLGQTLHATVEPQQRIRTARNHSATHLLHYALREVLGMHVQQKGSLVDASKTRFDFSHHAPLTSAETARIEEIVNAEILRNAPTQTHLMSYDEAVKSGATALFGEKYSDQVRVLEIGFSRELCGGTHVTYTGEIGLFKIISESGVAAGVRRIEAVTGDNAMRFVQALQAQLNEAAAALNVQPTELTQRIVQMQEQQKSLETLQTQLKIKLAAQRCDELAARAVEVRAGVWLLVAQLEDMDAKTLRTMVDTLKEKLKQAAIMLASVADGKVNLIAGVTAPTNQQVKAGELVNFVAQQVGGKGGGRPDLAQAGGTELANLSKALASVNAWVEARI